MAPRKSLPASLATPATGSSRKRNAPHTTPSRPNKRQRRVQDEPTAEPDVPTTPPDAEITVDSADVPKPDAEMTEADMEAELEAWQDFAADHYEMVEQLPLELHRNFRLLRELDDGCTSQSTLLLAKMRDYLAYRLGPKRAVFSKAAEATEDAGEPAADAEEAIAEGQEGHAEVNDTDVVNSEPPPKPVVPETVNGPEDMGMPVPDGQGGVLLPAADEPEEPVEERLSFPDAPAEANGGPEGTSISVPREANAEAGPSTVNETGRSREEQPAYIDVLPEIGKLSREIVRNAEEKLAIAVGAYNTIDRHIRALDSALSSQEASILLGLRPDTAPSAAVDTSLNLPGDQAVIGQDANGETTLGLGGGGGRKRGKKSKKKAEVEPVTVVPEAGITIPVDIEADPTEPRYCFCNQVSYGEMVGCDNDDCPREWFHLACVGLEAPPSGRWYCSDCKPKTGLGMGGAGTGGGAARRKSAGGRKKR